ncbi:flagellar basal body-associated FliL family protein [Alkalibaculum sporogenes]|nr:flagellar basal body-associated FliL family protein [Alkalibaculum sporogenes]
MAQEEIEKKSKKKLIIIILVAVIILLISVIGYFAVTGNQVSDIVKLFEKDEEYTTLLDEFVVNLNSISGSKNYLKVQVALMYKKGKQGAIIEYNVNKIRDIIIDDLRVKTAEQIMDVDNISKIKNEIIEDINNALDDEIVKDVYFTNMIIQ